MSHTHYSATGGIAGDNNGTIEGCESSGSVSSSSYAGGIAGGNDGTITNCTSNSNDISAINTADSSIAYMGGFIGYNNAATTLTGNRDNSGMPYSIGLDIRLNLYAPSNNI
ncbi:MAG: hypothetical protein LBO03_02960 [Acidaminococcales bacterium]|jgi:hypothetical protein|nr:hypothetical protein [Acidaminococcales bacterium]